MDKNKKNIKDIEIFKELNATKYAKEIEVLAEELRDGKLIIFVGAGVSMNSKLPSWNELIRDYAEKLGMIKENEQRSFNGEETLEIPEIYYDKFGKIKYYEILEKRFNARKYSPNSIHKTLKKMNLNYIITTNYDKLIEDEFENKKIYDIITKDNELPYSKTNKAIIKMHGDLKNRNIVLKKSDYDNYEKNFPLISTFIKGLFTSNTILFIGYSLNDVNVKDIINWINEILEDDFRKVYLVDFQENNILLEEKYKKNELVNRISLDIINNREETLKNFLEEIIEKKEIILNKENFTIYEDLNYLTEYNLKKINQYSQLFIDNNNKRILKLKNDFKDFHKYEKILYKSKIKEIIINIDNKNQNILIPFDNNEIKFDKNKKKEKDNLDNLVEIENELIELICNYDYCTFKNLTQKYINNETIEINKLVIVYGYIFFQKIEEAENIIKIIIKEDKSRTITKERIVWNYFINDIINKMMPKKKLLENGKTLEDIYYNYFRIQNQLYEEIFKYSTLESIYYEMNEFFDKVRNEKRVSYLGTPPLIKAIFLVKDLFYFCFLNGLYDKHFSNSNYLEIIKKYIEILFIAYTNKVEEDSLIFSGINKLKKFEYFDFYMMMELDYKNLDRLLFDYKVNEINCDTEVQDQVIHTFKNILYWLEDIDENNKNNFWNAENSLKKILLLLSKLELNKNQFDRIINLIIKFKNVNIFFQKIPFFSEIIENFKELISKNSKYLDRKFFDKILKKIYQFNNLEESLTNHITYYFEKNNIKKLERSEKINQFLNKTDAKIKKYFLRLFKELDFKTLKKNILTDIKSMKKFKEDIHTYIFLLSEKYIAPIESIEDRIFEIFNKTLAQNKNLDIYSINSETILTGEILEILMSLCLNHYVTDSFIVKLREYKNEQILKNLKHKGINNLWKYSLNQDNFDFSQFTEKELKYFTEYGIKNLLKKENMDLSNIVKEYVKSNLPNDKILKAYFEYINKS